MTFILTARIQARQGCEAALEAQIRKVLRDCSGQRGMITYRAHKNTKCPGEFFYYEEYEDADCFKAHIDSSEAVAYRATVEDLLESRQIDFWEEVSPA